MTSSYQSFSKVARFSDLIASVEHCDLCPRMCHQRKVLSSENGNAGSKVLFVAEAPGRLGADRTGVPLHGDRTGDNFEALLGNIGWRREDIFVTNAVLCNPKEENGNNGTPTTSEIANCSAYLEMVVTLVDPDVVVTLGAAALSAIGLLSPHGTRLRNSVAQLIPWRQARLFPLYHPGPRALIHRSLTKQRSDFMRLSKVVHPVKGLIQRKSPRARTAGLLAGAASPMQQVARVLLELGGQMTYFKMTKLMYLVDLFALERLGHTVASDIYLRQVDGPWPPDLDKALTSMQGYEARRSVAHMVPVVAPGPASRFQIELNDNVVGIIAEVYRRYGSMNNAAIKAAVYRTDPMRFILRCERQGTKMLNKPVLYKGKTAQDLAEQ